MKKSIGIIGPGKHFQEKIYPILSKSNFFKITGVLRKKKKSFKKIPNLTEKIFFKKNFDFVYICCPNKLHEKYILQSLRSNYHVISEKPFIVNNKNLQKIINLAKKKNKLIFEAFMYVYHPVFKYLKEIIDSNKFGKVKYAISNFRFPSLKINNNRYNIKEGDGFYNDAASYLISLESYLFNFNKSKKFYNFFLKKIKKKVDLRGSIFIKEKEQARYYFWGEGQSYSNNIEIFFENATVKVDKFFSKKKNEKVALELHKERKKVIKFKPINHFSEMFKKISKNYNKKEFLNLNYNLIKNQAFLLAKFRS